MFSFTNTIRNMADEIDNSHMRANIFLRATEIRPFTPEIKTALVKLCSNMLGQLEILRNIKGPYEERVEIVNKLFLTLMEYPEFLALYPKFRMTTEMKQKELMNEIANIPNLEESVVLKDYKYYLSMLKARADYKEYYEMIHAKPVEHVNPLEHVKPLVQHHYNLRSRTVY